MSKARLASWINLESTVLCANALHSGKVKAKVELIAKETIKKKYHKKSHKLVVEREKYERRTEII